MPTYSDKPDGSRRPGEGILAAIGNTPLVELDRILAGHLIRVYAKLEKCNPGGSIKDRSACYMLADKIRSGELKPGRSVVIESSSGNLAVGLAQVCRYFGVRLICVVDAKTAKQSIETLRALGAEVEIVLQADPGTGEYLPARLRRVRELAGSIPHSYWPNQYANPLNAAAHEQTMREIAQALDGQIDYLLCATSSCGTLRGCADYVRRHGLATTVVAVDAAGSAVFPPERASRRLIPGHGAAVRPQLAERCAVDRVVHVSDVEAVVACRRLARLEAVLAGGSSGAVIAGLEKIAADIPPGSVCAVIFADGGERYLDTIYSDSWVLRHFGEISHLWKDTSEGGATGAYSPAR